MPGGSMGIALILYVWIVLISRSARGAQDSHTITDPHPALEAAASGANAQTPLQMTLNGVILVTAVLAPVVLVILWRRDVIRPGSLARRGVRNVQGWPWWFWLMAAVVSFFAAGVGAGMAGDIAVRLGAAAGGLAAQAASSMGGAVLGIAAAVLLIFLMETRSGLRSGLDMRLSRRDAGLGVLALVLAMPVVQAASILSNILYRVVTGDDPAAIAHGTLESLQRQPGNPAVWILIFAAVVGAPILEELVFRVFLQTAALRLTGSAWIAVLATSALFTAAHIGDQSVGSANWHALLALFVLSIALGLSYEWTRRPAVPILLHMGFNAFNVGLVLLLAV
jgi:membrane protease YdiL (CAAX protease family)